MESDTKIDIPVEPLMFTQKPRILAQVGLFFALVTAGSYGFLSFSPPGYTPEGKTSNVVLIVSAVIFVLALIPAVYLLKVL